MDAVTEQVAAYFDNSEASEEEIEEEKEDCYTRFEHIKNKIANSDPGGTESEGSDSDPDDSEEIWRNRTFSQTTKPTIMTTRTKKRQLPTLLLGTISEITAIKLLKRSWSSPQLRYALLD